MPFKTARARVLLLGVLVFAFIIVASSWGPDGKFQTPVYAKQLTNNAYSTLKGLSADGKAVVSDHKDTANPVADVGSLMGGAADAPAAESKAKGGPPVMEVPVQGATPAQPAAKQPAAQPAGQPDPNISSPPSKASAQPPSQSLLSLAASLADPPVKVKETLLPMADPMSIKEALDSPTDLTKYHVISSLSTKTGTYFPMDFNGIASANPNLIPHYEKPNTWFMVAQRYKYITDSAFWFTQLICEATLINDVMTCIDPPLIAPIPATTSGDRKCTGILAIALLNAGPHDARVFYGPDRPYIMWGNNSPRNCFGLWAQDFRMMVSWNSTPWPQEGFRFPVDLSRPEPYAEVEKNWFFFWSDTGDMYLHHDIVPKRVFAKVEVDGSIGPDLATASREHDDKCMKALAPDWTKENESIHQGTNSLRITMCKRSDPTCKQTSENTFIMHILQHKTYYFWHGVYEPYVILYRESAPFAMHALSSKPIWVNGRKKAGQLATIPPLHPEMLYIVSFNWRDGDRMYHGYLDDVLMLGFGLEDKYSGGIDVTAEDLLGTLSLCSDLP